MIMIIIIIIIIILITQAHDKKGRVDEGDEEGRQASSWAQGCLYLAKSGSAM